MTVPSDETSRSGAGESIIECAHRAGLKKEGVASTWVRRFVEPRNREDNLEVSADAARRCHVASNARNARRAEGEVMAEMNESVAT